MPVPELRFGLQASPASDAAKSDHALYAEVVEDCGLAAELGFDTVWMLEHHFSDYYPTPSPLLFLSHIARDLPDIGLGTAVLVLPWYHPVRLAEEISMLSNLTRGRLQLGVGRGTAKMEYDPFGIDMNQARSRFAESVKILQLALSGEPFEFKGKYFSIPRPITLRPKPIADRIDLFGAIGSPGSAAIMAELGLPPFCLATFPNGLLARILESWKSRNAELGRKPPPRLPINVKMLIADTDEEAQKLGRRYLPNFFQLQCNHYETDSNPWDGIEDYKDFSRMLGNLRAFTDPTQLGPYMKMNFVGSPSTISARIEELAALGFDYFMVGATLPGIPRSLQRETATRFAREIAPKYCSAFPKR